MRCACAPYGFSVISQPFVLHGQKCVIPNFFRGFLLILKFSRLFGFLFMHDILQVDDFLQQAFALVILLLRA